MKKGLFLLLLVMSSFVVEAQNAKDIVSKAITEMSKKNNYKYTFASTERINGKNINVVMNAKLMQSPHKIYLNNTAGPNKGKELLYIKGENKNKVLINTFVNVSLSPFNSLIRKGNHYTILELGFGRVVSILKGAVKRAEQEASFDKVFTYGGSATIDGKACHKIVINDPTFKYVDYTIKNGESLYRIAMRLNVSEQLIIEKNSNLSGFNSASDGMQIKVPSSYAKKSVIYIDKANYHAVYQEIHDDIGLFEKYTFTNLKINPTFSENEFTADFSEYNF